MAAIYCHQGTILENRSRNERTVSQLLNVQQVLGASRRTLGRDQVLARDECDHQPIKIHQQHSAGVVQWNEKVL
jgi:hypothetical protein